MKAVLRAQREAIDKRNVVRAKQWLANGRIDMIVEAASVAEVKTPAQEMTVLLTDFVKTTQQKLKKLVGFPWSDLYHVGPTWTWNDVNNPRPITGVRQFIKREIYHNEPYSQQAAYLRGELIVTENGLQQSIAVARDSFAFKGKLNSMQGCLVFVNHDLALEDLKDCFVFSDGKITKWGIGGNERPEVSNATVICRGAVNGPMRFISGGSQLCLFANGTINIEKIRRWDSVFVISAERVVGSSR